MGNRGGLADALSPARPQEKRHATAGRGWQYRARVDGDFGPAADDAKPVSWIANELARRLGGTASWRHDAVPQFSEAHILKLDISKATSQLGWRPILPLNIALEWVVEWYRAFPEGADLAHLTRAQIERYEALTVGHAD